ncbi:MULTISPECIES: preprotein translocase subunit SecD [Methanobacterium]|jgi:preprotein translocase subunit SecD|uniref:Protein-export membrane protein SecD n=1 Tax=Methanobacterium veterum TaxID=408577 RepID=A0A9E5A0G2_9EURY|nr:MULTISPECIES: preprotein translocase subunit SecD [Methanobacterium]MCZ3364568.1 preprotein translocase subunit SecD [Methanobacterium veterum]MCZ3372322.1 preprotein translocase subunit SecD [Methanobacterium veterum]
MSEIADFLKDYRVILLIVLAIGSIVSISVLGIQQGLDLEGGSVIQIHLEHPVDQNTMNTVVTVLDRRLNIFGVRDINVRASGDQDVIVEIAGVRPEEVTNIVGTPGVFEAKIDNQTALTGTDITNVRPYQITGNQWSVPFTVSTAGANRFAQVAQGKAGQPVEMYLDNQLVSSPVLSEGLATGTPTTEVEVSGTAETREAAENEARNIQAVLQSGALPVKVNVAGVSSVSAELGDQFRTGALVAGLLAVIVVSIIIFLRYRIPLLVIPIILTSLAELLLILGVASVIRWNIDLPAIAGIIAAIGTGVDDQLIITDEVLKKKGSKGGKESKRRSATMRMRIKGAFFIVFTSAATLIAAMLPLAYIGFSRGYAGIGILAGFAFTTIIGVLIGIFITRPVYAKFIERFVQ